MHANQSQPEDCLILGALEMHESPEVAILQHGSGVMQVANNVFENGSTYHPQPSCQIVLTMQSHILHELDLRLHPVCRRKWRLCSSMMPSALILSVTDSVLVRRTQRLLALEGNSECLVSTRWAHNLLVRW
jgi:hypothetical protein